MTFNFNSTSSSETTKFAVSIGKKLRGNEVISLTSDLGGGKTTFTKGLVKGSGSSDNVTSPSFNVKNEYTSAKFSIYHYDFYRLSEPGIIKQELEEALSMDNSVIILEWAQVVSQALPRDTINIEIKVISENSRSFNCTFAKEYSYLFERLSK